MKTSLHSFLGDQKNFSQKVKLSNLYLFGIAILALFALTNCASLYCTNCMMNPINNEWGSRYQENYFSGDVSSPSTNITIQALNPQTNNWENIGQTTSMNSPGPYAWSTWLVIPDKYWKAQQREVPPQYNPQSGCPSPPPQPGVCAIINWSALVRSVSPQGPLDSLKTWDCLVSSPITSSSKCLSPQSPAASVTDYTNFGQACVDQINKIRAAEGRPPLQRYVDGECTADSDARANYEHHLSHPNDNWHFCASGNAQNGCPDYSSADDIINTCIWKQQYQCEKPCYQQNPTSTCSNPNYYGGCTSPYDCAPAGTMCGHYVNMVVCPDYTKVACGIYIAPDGSFVAVENFYK